MTLPNPRQRMWEDPELLYSEKNDNWYFERYSSVPGEKGSGRYENSQTFTSGKTADSKLNKDLIVWHEAQR